MEKIMTVLSGFQAMGASPAQLLKEFIRMTHDSYYRDEWFHVITEGRHE